MEAREAELRHRLTEAVYLGHVREAAQRERQLRRILADRAEGDVDLEIVRQWLHEQADLQAALELERRQASRRSRLKLLLTALPLAFAALLTALLSIVLIWG